MESTKKSAGKAVYGQAMECLNKACVIIIEEPVNGQKFCSTFCKDSHWAYVREEGKKVVNGGSSKHFASMNSKKLKAMLYFLQDGKPHTTLDIIFATLDCAYYKSIQALRHWGYNIPPAKFIRTTPEGKRLFEYQLIEEVRNES